MQQTFVKLSRYSAYVYLPQLCYIKSTILANERVENDGDDGGKAGSHELCKHDGQFHHGHTNGAMDGGDTVIPVVFKEIL
jgi:hypothetical protein